MGGIRFFHVLFAGSRARKRVRTMHRKTTLLRKRDVLGGNKTSATRRCWAGGMRGEKPLDMQDPEGGKSRKG